MWVPVRPSFGLYSWVVSQISGSVSGVHTKKDLLYQLGGYIIAGHLLGNTVNPKPLNPKPYPKRFTAPRWKPPALGLRYLIAYS